MQKRNNLERFRDAAHYVEAIRAAALALVAEGFMLDEDVARVIAAAAGWGKNRHVVRLPSAGTPWKDKE
jgi:hypothetical protein